MKACFVGTGSIGKRHIRNLYEICSERQMDLEIHVFRSSKTTLPDDIARLVNKQLFDYRELRDTYDAIFITNPTSVHYQTLQDIGAYSNCFYIEKPLFETKRKNIAALNLSDKKTYYIACPLRYTNVINEARQVITKEKTFSARVICSSYLPDWRQGVDYRKVYSANKEMGGGVCLDLIHEWDYLTHLFGFPDRVFKICGKYSDLEINSEDLAVYIARYKDMLVEVHLDYFGREPKRLLEVYTGQSSWTFDILQETVMKNGKILKDMKEDGNQKYIREMNFFLDVCFGEKRNTNPISHALRVMDIAE
ncbi:MAG: gfo/Idh/MocA family oxidoreductase [Desulfosporosinus sp.]|nr:gfo/Idh/MocA family oxidoreductase [Desulfosporosinus sp.]